MSAQVIPFPRRRHYPFGLAPAFDPANPVHVEAWQDMFESGCMIRDRMERERAGRETKA